MDEALRKIISDAVEKLFASAKFRLLGPQSISHYYSFQFKGFDPKATLVHAYLDAHTMHSPDEKGIDKNSIKSIVKNAENYIDTLKQKAEADVTRIVTQKIEGARLQSKLQEIPIREYLLGKDGQDLIKQIRNELEQQKDKIDDAFQKIVDAETVNSQVMGVYDGILRASKAMGIDDPLIIKRGVIDERLTDQCKHLWHNPNNINIPKVYKMSELKPGYGDPKGPWEPTYLQSHYNCRHIPVPMPPGFGLDNDGNIVYKGKDPETGESWDEYKKQRNIK